jgi:hypothetical protein
MGSARTTFQRLACTALKETLGSTVRNVCSTNRPLIRDQAFGEALDPDKLEQLGRYETHLDRMLVMLLRLKGLRNETVEG